jgi:hypothetical protein
LRLSSQLTFATLGILVNLFNTGGILDNGTLVIIQRRVVNDNNERIFNKFDKFDSVVPQGWRMLIGKKPQVAPRVANVNWGESLK